MSKPAFDIVWSRIVNCAGPIARRICGILERVSTDLCSSSLVKEVMRDKKARIGQGAAGRLTLVKKREIVRSITAVHYEKTGAPRYLIQVIFYAVAPDSHYVIGRPAPANQIWILIGQGD